MVMRKTALRAACMLWVWLLLVCLPVTLWAAESRIFDDAALLDAQQISMLEEQIQAFRRESGHDFVVVTTNDTAGKTTVDFARDYYDNGAFGTGKNGDGALLLVDMQNRELYICATGAMIDILTDQRISQLLDRAASAAGDGDFARVVTTVLSGVQGYIKEGAPRGQRIDSETGGIYSSGLVVLDPFGILFALGIGAAVGGSAAFGVVRSYQRGPNAYQYSYRDKGKILVRHSDTQLVNRFVTTRIIPKQTSSGAGNSTVGRSSSGRMHGGGGRKF